MPQWIKRITAGCFLAAVFSAVCFHICSKAIYKEICLTLAITFGTTAYHLGIRLLVGFIFHLKMQNRADYTKKWYQVRSWEPKLYQYLHVKSWKGRMPTYHLDTFSREKHSWDEIAQAMCQSELVHEVNMILSFAPLILSVWFGEFAVFFLTSVGGAVFDSLFVIMQRYNRPRVVKIVQKQRAYRGEEKRKGEEKWKDEEK